MILFCAPPVLQKRDNGVSDRRATVAVTELYHTRKKSHPGHFSCFVSHDRALPRTPDKA